MTKKNAWPVLILAGLAVVYAVWFTHWFRPQPIRVFHTLRMLHFRQRRGDSDRLLIFGLDPRDVRLTDIKVVALADYEKNPQVLPMWRLVSEAGSAPLREFVYGQPVRGMHPLVAGQTAAPLDATTEYRVLVKTRRRSGWQDFKMSDAPPPASAPAPAAQ